MEASVEDSTNDLEFYAARKLALIDERERHLKYIQQLDINAQRQYGLIYNRASGPSKLPNEILYTIFRFAQGVAGKAHYDRPCPPFGEVVVSHVCSRWRRLALSFSPLWSGFCCVAKPGSWSRTVLCRLEAYLERSKEQPLDLWFDISGKDTCNDAFIEMLTLIIALGHIPRLRRFLAVTGMECLVAIQTDLGEVSVPKLEQFVVVATTHRPTSFPRNTLQEWSPNMFANSPGGAPMLKYLRIDCVGLRIFRAPLDNIVHLRLEEHITRTETCLAWSAFISILQLPLLESLSIRGEVVRITPGELGTEHGPTIEMKRLRHLRIGTLDDVILEHLLLRISAPHLETLTLCDVFFPSDPRPDILFRAVFPSLWSLTFIDVWVDTLPGCHDIFLYLAAVTKAAKRIEIFVLDAGQHVLDLLVSSGNTNPPGEPLWPEMEHLTACDNTSIPYNVFTSLAQSWPKLNTFRIPAEVLDGWARVVPQPQTIERFTLEGLARVECQPWPPGCEWSDCAPDPFAIQL